MNTAHFIASSHPAPGPGPDSASEPQLRKDGHPLSVIIVEDDLQVAGLLKDILEQRGGRVARIAAEPSEAFGLVVEYKPDAVIMDVRLKDGRDGLHAAAAMRLLRQTPIVFCTASADVETLKRIRQFGGAPCLFKPIKPGELAHAILRACGL
jgi:two-component system, response regulator PdtaR